MKKYANTSHTGLKNNHSNSNHLLKSKASLEELYNSVILGRSKPEIEDRLESLMKSIKTD